MADKSLKWEENAKGKYYVDKTCITAKFCVATAPDIFQLDESGTHAFVARQPQTPEEEQLVREAMLGCPVGAIGDDGEEEG
ncbi:MAG: ferredoxin [Acidobacteriota bacterium]